MIEAGEGNVNEATKAIESLDITENNEKTTLADLAQNTGRKKNIQRTQPPNFV